MASGLRVIHIYIFFRFCVNIYCPESDVRLIILQKTKLDKQQQSSGFQRQTSKITEIRVRPLKFMNRQSKCIKLSGLLPFSYWYEDGCLVPTMGTVYIAIDRATKENGCLKVMRFNNFLNSSTQ